MSDLLACGVDIGSTASKCVILRQASEVVASCVVPVGAGTSGPMRAIAGALRCCGKQLADMACICSTGYGRNSLEQADFETTELACHAKGAYALFPQVRTLLDMGGQDAKAMRIGPDGRLANFVMNDKCAAGTGRFLDVMARVLDVDISDLAGLGARSTKKMDISSTCTVFAESEVISHLANNAAITDVVAGIHRSVASRAIGLLRRVGIEEQLVMTGGVARNEGVVESIGAGLGIGVVTSPFAQFVGAFGAALMALERAHEREQTRKIRSAMRED